jgi:hypothetical protein
MDRDEYLRRACVLEARAAEFAYPGLRTALLNIAAQYRSLAKQVVARMGRRRMPILAVRGPSELGRSGCGPR